MDVYNSYQILIWLIQNLPVYQFHSITFLRVNTVWTFVIRKYKFLLFFSFSVPFLVAFLRIKISAMKLQFFRSVVGLLMLSILILLCIEVLKETVWAFIMGWLDELLNQKPQTEVTRNWNCRKIVVKCKHHLPKHILI